MLKSRRSHLIQDIARKLNIPLEKVEIEFGDPNSQLGVTLRKHIGDFKYKVSRNTVHKVPVFIKASSSNSSALPQQIDVGMRTDIPSSSGM